MIVRFKKLQIENFMSFESALISFDNSGYTLIAGENRNPSDCASSNGSGKSSIWEALCWVLTGETIRGCKNVQNIYSSGKETAVTVEFELDNRCYIITRIKDSSKSNMQITVDGVDKSGKGIREGEAILSNLLPDLTPDLLGSVILLGQGLPCRLSSRTPAGRKELLESLTHSDFMISDIKSRLSDRKQNLTQEVLDARSKIETERKAIAWYNSNLVDLEGSIKLDIKKLEEELSSTMSDINSLQETKTNTNDSIKRLEELRKQYLGQLFDLKTRETGVIQEIEDKYRTDIESLTSQISWLKASLSIKKTSIANLKSQPDICPTCGQKINKPLENIGIWEREASEIEEQIKQQESNLNAVKSKRQAEIEAFRNSINNDVTLYSEANERNEAQLQQESKNLTIINAQIDALSAKRVGIESNIKLYNVSITDRDRKTQELQEKIKSSENKILYYNSEVTDRESRLDIVNKMITLSNRDFRGYLLSDIISYMDSVMKKYGEIVFNHNNIDFKLDGNSLDIIYCGRYYESLSGGERQKIDIIVQFALRNMLTNLFGFSANILVMDEIFDAMDTDSCQQVINFISSEMSDVESVYLITHHKELQIPYDHEIRVVKDKDNISRIC